MLTDSTAHAVVAVKDLDQAKKFYGETLGLKLKTEIPGGLLFASGNSDVFVYSSEFAGTNKATCVFWESDDVDGCVAELKSKGIVFESYDMPGVQHEGDIHVMGSMRAAWFKDPDGNILNVTNGAL